MSYVDVNVPVIEKITLPSGNTYFIADREIRDVVQALSEAIAGGVSFVIAWDGTSAPVVAGIPEGVTVTYNGTTYTGTLDANNSQPGAFYLVKSATTPSGEPVDSYDEYVAIGSTGSKVWEKIGDTKVDLSDVVTGVSLSKQTDSVIGSDATFTITQPTIALATDATSGTGKVQIVTGISSATATGGAVSASGDSVTAMTGLGTPSTESAVKSVTPTTKKLATTTVTGVSGSTTPSVVQGRTSQTTATGAGTASTTNTDWLKGVSVSSGVLTIGAATMGTQTTYSANAPSQITIPTAASSATTVATGATTTSGTGADIVTDVSVGDTFSAVTGYASPTTDTVLGTASTFSVTDPTITVKPSKTYIKGTASGANTAWNSKDTVTVLKSTTDVSVTKGA